MEWTGASALIFAIALFFPFVSFGFGATAFILSALEGGRGGGGGYGGRGGDRGGGFGGGTLFLN